PGRAERVASPCAWAVLPRVRRRAARRPQHAAHHARRQPAMAARAPGDVAPGKGVSRGRPGGPLDRPRTGAIADGAAVGGHLVGTGIAEPGRIGCMGLSYGGYLTLAALVTYPTLFAVGVDVCGMANFETFFAGSEPWIAAAAVGKYGDPALGPELLRGSRRRPPSTRRP